jgi:hypothetical protein
MASWCTIANVVNIFRIKITYAVLDVPVGTAVDDTRGDLSLEVASELNLVVLSYVGTCTVSN